MARFFCCDGDGSRSSGSSRVSGKTPSYSRLSQAEDEEMEDDADTGLRERGRSSLLGYHDFMEREGHDYERIPKWARAHPVDNLWQNTLKDIPDYTVVPARAATPPALRWIFLSLYLSMQKDVSIFVLAYLNARCDDNAGVYPMWIWGVFVPFCLPMLVIEFICWRYSIIPYFQSVGTLGWLWTLCQNNPHGFTLWLLSSALQSIVMIMDGASDGLFAATTLVTFQECDGASNHLLRHIWHTVMDHSVFGLFTVRFDLEWLVFGAWLMLSLQMIYPAVYTLPCCKDLWKFLALLDFSAGEGLLEPGPRCIPCDKATPPLSQYCPHCGGMLQLPPAQEQQGLAVPQREFYDPLCWKNVFGEKVTSGDALYMLGDALGMSTIAQQTLTYPRSRATEQHRIAREQGRVVDPRVVFYLRTALEICNGRLLLNGVLETAIQLNLQLSILAVHLASAQILGSKATNLAAAQIGLSACLSGVSAVSRLSSTFKFVAFARDVMRWLKEDNLNGWTEEQRQDWESCKRKSYFSWALLAVFVVLLSLAICKAVMLFRCPFSVWNMSGGCVDFSDLPANYSTARTPGA